MAVLGVIASIVGAVVGLVMTVVLFMAVVPQALRDRRARQVEAAAIAEAVNYFYHSLAGTQTFEAVKNITAFFDSHPSHVSSATHTTSIHLQGMMCAVTVPDTEAGWTEVSPGAVWVRITKDVGGGFSGWELRCPRTPSARAAMTKWIADQAAIAAVPAMAARLGALDNLMPTTTAASTTAAAVMAGDGPATYYDGVGVELHPLLDRM